MTRDAIVRRDTAVVNRDWKLIAYFGILVLLTFGLLLSPAAKLLAYAFPVLSVLFAGIIYGRSKTAYAGFVCWLWMLAPLLRRMAEYRAGGLMPLIIASPFLACAVPFLVKLRRPGELLSSKRIPVILASAGIFYGLGIGLLNHNAIAFIAGGAAFWVAPILFAFFIFDEQQQLRAICDSIERAFVWGAFVIGAYGIYQYLILAPWDALWIETSGLASIGVAEPQQMRVFSTMNSPQSLASFLVAGILISIRSKSAIKWLGIPLASLSLLLTQSRTGWFGFLAGLAYLFIYLPTRQRIQIAVFGVLSTVLVIVALQGDQRDVLGARLQTLTAPSEDGSFTTRLAGYAALLPTVLEKPYGAGIGYDEAGRDSPTSRGGEGLGTGDSAVVAIVFSLGIPGTLTYLAGIISSLASSFRRASDSRNAQAQTFGAIAIAMAISALATDVFQGPSGFLTWLALSISSVVGLEQDDAIAIRSLSRGGGQRTARTPLEAFHPPLHPPS